MGKGKKKTKGKKRDGKKTNDEGSKCHSMIQEPTPEQKERAIEAAVNRTEDPLENWARPSQEECPICMLPLPWDPCDISYMNCCGKLLCSGCILSNYSVVDELNTALCVFCRVDNSIFTTDKSRLEQIMKLANTGNGEALRIVAGYHFKGMMGLQQDKAEGLRWYHRSMEAGCGMAAYSIGACYYQGDGVELAAFSIGNFYEDGDGVEKDNDKALEYFQKAACEPSYIPTYYYIGNILMTKGEIEEAMLNYRKAAICGMSDDSLFGILRNGYTDGFITKDEYAFTLRETQAACNEMKSDGREAWKKMLSERKLYH